MRSKTGIFFCFVAVCWAQLLPTAFGFLATKPTISVPRLLRSRQDSERIQLRPKRQNSFASHRNFFLQNVRSRPQSTSTVSTSMVISPTVQASGALIGSTLSGLVAERYFSNSGIIVTMAVAAMCSNLSLIPTHHHLYDLCWSTFLPASLAFLLLASDGGESDMSSPDNREVQSTKETINSVSVPFLVASIGSIIGCTASFLVCRKFPSLWLSPEDAAVAAGCLCASFIGGSVNFFVTANVIGDSGSISSLLSSMAAADLLVMAAYFSIMAASLKSNFLSKIFGGSSNASKGASEDQNERKDKSNRTVKSHAGNSKVLGTKALATVVVSALAFSIVKISTHIEKMAASIIPGLACAIIAILAPAAQRFLFSKKNNGLVREIQNVASPLSDVCFLLLFASIGTSANLEEALLQGPACLSFSILALAVHIIAVVGGSLQVKKWLRLNFVLEDVLVASNAAIGGPSTAAAFAGRMKGSRQRGLTMAGTVMGIIGYAVGTTVGVTLFRILQKFVLS